MNKLVSIISPCYNGAKYLAPFLDSVLEQTYRPLELLFVDDGSTDNTKEIVMSYKEKFDLNKVSLVYIYKENGGQASAINAALSVFSGDFMMWVDSDDILLPENVEKKVDYLEDNHSVGFVLCQGLIVNSVDINKTTGVLARIEQSEPDSTKLFEDLIFVRNVVFGPGTIMIRRQALVSAIPSLHIFESREGQNWQLMLPIAYNCKYGIINEPLFKYVIHENSHSHKKRSLKELIMRNQEFELLIKTTICGIYHMGDDEKNKWKKVVHVKYLRENFQLCCIYNNYFDAWRYKKALAKENELTIFDRVLFFKLKVFFSKIKNTIFKFICK